MLYFYYEGFKLGASGGNQGKAIGPGKANPGSVDWPKDRGVIADFGGSAAGMDKRLVWGKSHDNGGMVAPAANNAAIELEPDKAASITGVRQLARRTGGIIAVSASTLVLQTSASMNLGFTLVFGVVGLLLLLSLPAVFAMPESPVTIDHCIINGTVHMF
jgi:hypothetical protein